MPSPSPPTLLRPDKYTLESSGLHSKGWIRERVAGREGRTAHDYNHFHKKKRKKKEQEVIFHASRQLHNNNFMNMNPLLCVLIGRSSKFEDALHKNRGIILLKKKTSYQLCSFIN